ncbi:MAG TPA: carbamoyltransferase HypF [Myxococcota bacterium]|nr:carbamoyltransferase HypF [Myxococcota bacterium]
MQVRRELYVRGAVQGVGFRPWAARRARELGLAGDACNAPEGVHVTVEGPLAAVERFLAALRSAPPAGAVIEAVELRESPPRGAVGFAIGTSVVGTCPALPRVPPDAPICSACLAELFDPRARRHRYAFTHCARCGPRAAVLAGLPWDRERSALAAFPPCPPCRAEYEDPGDHRHHAETIACPACGPRLRAVASDGMEPDGDPVELAAASIRAGGIVALKGYGGFHLACDATNDHAVAELRARKARPVKPFAVLVPDAVTARRLAALSPRDESLLAGPVRPVLLAPRRRDGCGESGLAAAVAPGIRDLGLILPCAPLHWLILFAPGTAPAAAAPRFAALVLTSANATGEPTLYRSAEARERLRGVADLIVDHDRDILRPNDDGVLRCAPSGPIPVRLSRGNAPIVLALPGGLRARAPVAALGGDLKCAPALAWGGELLLAEHVGDLASVAAAEAAVARVGDLARLAGAPPAVVAHDLHPDGVGRELAREIAPRRVAVQHHHAHAVACLLEHGRTGPALALALDGLGYGADGTLWGGELLRVEAASFERLAHLECARLPGGDAAAREPWRMAAVWLARAFPEGPPALPWHGRRDPERLAAVLALAERGVASPVTSSCGRLFDAVASLLDLVDEASHEAEAALALESAADGARPARLALEPQPRAPDPGEGFGDGPAVIPAAPLVRAIAAARARGEPAASLAAAFHDALAGRLAAAACAFAGRLDLSSVVLTGGCFQNRLLLETLSGRLAASGLEVLSHRRLPPGDGGLAAGQAVVAVAREAAASG